MSCGSAAGACAMTGRHRIAQSTMYTAIKLTFSSTPDQLIFSRRCLTTVDPHHGAIDCGQVGPAALRHVAGHFRLQQFEHRLDTLGAIRGERPKWRTAQQHGLSAEGDPFEHIAPAPETAVDENRRLPANC